MGFLRNKFVLGIFALSVLSCTESVSVPKDFVHLYGDLRVAEREYGGTTPDGRIVRLRVLEKYGYTAHQFDSVADVIQKHSELWRVFQDSVVAYTDSIAVAAGAIAPQPKINLPNLKGKK